MGIINKSIVILGVTLLVLGNIAQGCEELSSLLITYDFQSVACKRSMFTSGLDCELCELDLPTIVSTLSASSSESCQTYARSISFNCAYDSFNEEPCSEVLEESSYFNCTGGYFSCCVGVYADYVGQGASNFYDYDYLCSVFNPTQEIPNFGECTTVDTTGVTPLDLPEIPDENSAELDLECPEMDTILAAASVGSTCFAGAMEDNADFNLLCSEECAEELAAVYDALIATGTTGCAYTAKQVQVYCLYDTSMDSFCIELGEIYNDTCSFAKSCCGVGQLAIFEKFAETLSDAYKTYLEYTLLSIEAELACPEGTVVAEASTCESASFVALTGQNGPNGGGGAAAQISLWFVAVLATILSIYFSM